MVDRENSNRLPPFWEARRYGNSVVYVDTLTDFATGTRPPPLRGGLLGENRPTKWKLLVFFQADDTSLIHSVTVI